MRGKSSLLPEAGFDPNALLAPQQALTLFFSHADIRATGTETVRLADACGRILGRRVIADANYPSAARSAMDGFALRSEDTPGALQIVGEVRMGSVWRSELPPRTAIRIPTGGVIPPGADAVVPIEEAREEAGLIRVAQIAHGSAVTPAGSDMQLGEALLEPGRRVGGAELGVLATLGLTQVTVYRRPRIAVISSGDELVNLECTPGEGQIRDSNRWAIAGTLFALGAQAMHFSTSADNLETLVSVLGEALEEADAVLLTGGSSVGAHDLTPDAIDRVGDPGVIVHGLRVKPGKPTALGLARGKPIIGLPGNPTSALMILQAVAAPIVAALAGTVLRVPQFDSTTDCEYCKRSGWTWYVPVQWENDEAIPQRVHPLQMRSSMVSLLARAGGFITLDESIDVLAPGQMVRVTRFL